MSELETENRVKSLSTSLTPREVEVVKAIHACLSNKEIANNLNLTESTVKEYNHRIFKKLNFNNRTQVAIWASKVLGILILAVNLLGSSIVTVTQTNAPTPASLSVFASDGDLTYCVATPSSGVKLSLTCRRNGVTKLITTTITDTVVINVGDLCWLFQYDISNSRLIHFQVAENVRNSSMVITGNVMKSQGDILWL